MKDAPEPKLSESHIALCESEVESGTIHKTAATAMVTFFLVIVLLFAQGARSMRVMRRMDEVVKGGLHQRPTATAASSSVE
jgi:hypothetical protein